MLRLLTFIAVLTFVPLQSGASESPAGPARKPPVVVLASDDAGGVELATKPFASRDQERRRVPRRVQTNVYPPPDRGNCLLNMVCVCEGGTAWDGSCLSGSKRCSRWEGGFCAYVCDDPFWCYSLTEEECNQSREC